MTSNVAAVWSHRNVLHLLVRRDLTVKYQQSVLGYFWSLVEPLAIATIYWFVFGVLYETKVSPDGPPYPMFILSGIFAFQWLNSALGESTSALTGQARLITTMKVPREVFPFGRVVGRFAEYLAGLPIIIVGAVVFGAPFGWTLFFLPLAILLQGSFLIGISLLLSSVNVLLRDVERIVRLVQRILFYATPIIYPLSKVTESSMPGWVKEIYLANPLVGIFQLHHAAWYPSEVPSTRLIVIAVAGCVMVLLGGWWIFRRLEPAVLKEL